MNINNTCIFCCHFSTSFRSANPNLLDWDQNSGVRSLDWAKRL